MSQKIAIVDHVTARADVRRFCAKVFIDPDTESNKKYVDAIVAFVADGTCSVDDNDHLVYALRHPDSKPFESITFREANGPAIIALDACSGGHGREGLMAFCAAMGGTTRGNMSNAIRGRDWAVMYEIAMLFLE